MTTIGAGVREVRIREASAYRVMYLSKFASAIHVLHCFRKTTQRTAKPDLECAERRYRQLVQEET
jgi:phage-related protein